MIDVLALMVEGHSHVEGMAGHDDVSGLRIQWDPVQGGVRLDEPAVLLRVQLRGQLVARSN
jgi:hypothetical protein